MKIRVSVIFRFFIWQQLCLHGCVHPLALALAELDFPRYQNGLTLSLPRAIIIGFCKQHWSRWDGSVNYLIWICAVWHSFPSDGLLTLVMLNKLRYHTSLQFSANQITWSCLLIQIQILNGKQCRSKSVGFHSSEANWSVSTLFAKTGHVVFSKRRVKIKSRWQMSSEIWHRKS